MLLEYAMKNGAFRLKKW